VRDNTPNRSRISRYLMLSQIRALNLMSRHVCLQDNTHITGLLFRLNVERELADVIN